MKPNSCLVLRLLLLALPAPSIFAGELFAAPVGTRSGNRPQGLPFDLTTAPAGASPAWSGECRGLRGGTHVRECQSALAERRTVRHHEDLFSIEQQNH